MKTYELSPGKFDRIAGGGKAWWDAQPVAQ